MMDNNETPAVPKSNGANGVSNEMTERERPLHGPRESTFESADQAAGIYSLYGDSLAGDGNRDSWRASAGSIGQGNASGRVGPNSGPRTPLRNSFTQDDAEGMGTMEQLGTEYGVLGLGGQSSDNGIARSSMGSENPQVPTPDIKITPSKSNGLNEHDRRSTLSAATTPTHTNISRLSPRHPLGGSTTSATSSASALSFAGSSQYPGEEEDAFRVRSTCTSITTEIKYDTDTLQMLDSRRWACTEMDGMQELREHEVDHRTHERQCSSQTRTVTSEPRRGSF